VPPRPSSRRLRIPKGGRNLIPINIALVAYGYPAVGPPSYQSASQEVLRVAEQLNQTGGHHGPFFGISTTMAVVNAVLSILAGVAFFFWSAAAAIGNPVILAIAGTVGTILQALAYLYLWVMISRGQAP